MESIHSPADSFHPLQQVLFGLLPARTFKFNGDELSHMKSSTERGVETPCSGERWSGT